MQKINEKSLFEKTIAIDSYILIYQFLNSVRTFDGRAFTDKNKNPTSHLMGFLYRSLYYKESGLKPIFVFDGKPNEMKMEELKRRFEKRRNQKYAYQEALDVGTNKDKNKLFAAPKLNHQMLEDTFYLLKNLGFPIILAKSDGEAQCAQLVNNNIAFCTVSQDYDAFLYGSERVVRNLTKSKERKMYGRKVKVDVEYYNLNKILSTLEINQRQLIHLGLLIGTDFTNKVPGIGPKNALKLVQKYETLESIFDQKSLTYEGSYYEKAINIFENPSVHKITKVEKPKYDFEKVKEFLLEKGFGKDRLEKTLKKFRDLYTKTFQKTLSMYLK